MSLYDCFLPFIFHSSRLLVFQLVSYIFHSRMFSLSVVYWSSGSVHTSFYFHFGKVRKEKNLYITNIYISNPKLCFHIRSGAYREIEKGGARFEKCCDNRNEARRAEFAQGWGPGEGMCPSIG